jgi:hypothetical protein
MIAEILEYRDDVGFPEACPPDEPHTFEYIQNAGKKTFERYDKFWPEYFPEKMGKEIPLNDSDNNIFTIKMTEGSDEDGLMRVITIKQKQFFTKSDGQGSYSYIFNFLYYFQESDTYEFRFWDPSKDVKETNTNEAVNGFQKLTSELLSPFYDELKTEIPRETTF